MTAGTAPSTPGGAHALERELTAAGVVCAVEARGRLAILVGGERSAPLLASPERRAWAIAAAAAHGFTHVAVELRAAAPGGGSTGAGVDGGRAPLPRA